MRKIIAVSGRPGTGKTTLFREFIKLNSWEKVEPAQLVSAMYCKDLDLYILGKYDDGETFAGTDRLGMSCQPNVTEWIRSTNSNILFEGDRLTNGKFYNFLISLPDVDVQFLILKVKEATLIQRYKDRDSNQSETFLKGRETKIGNIQTNFEFMTYIQEFINETIEDQTKIITHIKNVYE